jgi:hypothetical protein
MLHIVFLLQAICSLFNQYIADVLLHYTSIYFSNILNIFYWQLTNYVGTWTDITNNSCTYWVVNLIADDIKTLFLPSWQSYIEATDYWIIFYKGTYRYWRQIDPCQWKERERESIQKIQYQCTIKLQCNVCSTINILSWNRIFHLARDTAKHLPLHHVNWALQRKFSLASKRTIFSCKIEVLGLKAQLFRLCI